MTRSTIIFTWGSCVYEVADPYFANAYLERVHFGYRLLTAVLLVVVREEHDILPHSLHVRVVLHKFVVLQLRVQDCPVKGNISDRVSLAKRSPYRMW